MALFNRKSILPKSPVEALRRKAGLTEEAMRPPQPTQQPFLRGTTAPSLTQAAARPPQPPQQQASLAAPAPSQPAQPPAQPPQAAAPAPVQPPARDTIGEAIINLPNFNQNLSREQRLQAASQLTDQQRIALFQQAQAQGVTSAGAPIQQVQPLNAPTSIPLDTPTSMPVPDNATQQALGGGNQATIAPGQPSPAQQQAQAIQSITRKGDDFFANTNGVERKLTEQEAFAGGLGINADFVQPGQTVSLQQAQTGQEPAPAGAPAPSAEAPQEKTLSQQLAEIQAGRQQLQERLLSEMEPAEREQEVERQLRELGISEFERLREEEGRGAQIGAVRGEQARIREAAQLERTALSGELDALANQRIGKINALEAALGFTEDEMTFAKDISSIEEKAELKARQIELGNMLATAEGDTLTDKYTNLVNSGEVRVDELPEAVFKQLLEEKGVGEVDNTFLETINGRRIMFKQNQDGDVIGQIDLGIAGTLENIGNGLISGVEGSITPGQLSPLARTIFDGTGKLSDLTPTLRATILPELNAVGWTSAITNEMKQEVSFIESKMEDILNAWDAIPGRQKGRVQGRIASLLKSEDVSPQLSAFNAQANIVGMTLTRMFEKGRISDEDRRFYLSLMPNINQNKEAAESGAKELVSLLNQRIQGNISQINTGVVQSTDTDKAYVDSLEL